MPDSAELAELFEVARRLFDTGDDTGAAILFQRYIAAGGTRRDEALLGIAGRREITLSLPAAHESIPKPPRPSAPLQRGPATAAAPPADSADRIWRRPHLDIPQGRTLQPADVFRAEIFTDKSDPSAGEMIEDVVIATAGSESRFELDVQLQASSHFILPNQAAGKLTIDRDMDRSASVVFDIRVESAGSLATLPAAPAPFLRAMFTYQGRPAGSVTRAVPIAGLAAAASPESTPAIRVEPSASAADLTVVIAATPENDNRHFLCTVSSPLLPAYATGVTQPWNLPDTTDKIVQAYMSEFTANASKLMRIASLRGAGKHLFDAAPQIFRDAFWALIDAATPLRTIAVISSEPYIPWELMIPYRATTPGERPETRRPIGVEFTVGRSVNLNLAAAAQSIPLQDSYVIAPQFAGPQALPNAAQEAAAVLKMFPGDLIQPATDENIDQKLGQGGRSLLHIVCHGSSSSAIQTLLLDNNQRLSANQICGLDGVEAGFLKRPLVFLNACEVGRLAPELAGPGGFAPAFLQLGARAVIAPLWSVMDTIAFDVATTFYDLLRKNPDAPLASLLQQLRAKAYDVNIGEDTYAAYCFYGDPLARVEQATAQSFRQSGPKSSSVDAQP